MSMAYIGEKLEYEDDAGGGYDGRVMPYQGGLLKINEEYLN